MWRLNFPTEPERAAAADKRAQTAADVAASVLLSQEAVAKRTAAGESTSPYHGVRWFKDDRHARWRSQILDDSTGKQIALGTFIDEVAAARAYDAAAREAHGDKAHGWPSRNRKRRWLNFPTAEEIAAVPAGSVDPAAIKALVSAAPTMIVPGTEGDSECAAVMQARRRKSAKRGAKPMGDVYALLHARMPQPVTEAALSEEFGYKELRVLLKHNGVPISDYDEGTGSYIEKTKGLNCKALVAVAPTMIVPGTQGEIDSPTGGAVVRRRKSARGAAKARGRSDF
jgi:hypothetical protein